MSFFINGFMAMLGAVTAVGVLWIIWNVVPLVIVAILPKVISKEKQAEFIRDLKKDKWRNAKVLRIARNLGWHEE